MTEPALELSAYRDMFRGDPEGFERVLACTGRSELSSHVCSTGEKVVCVQGRKLHSGRDPREEAKRFARNLTLEHQDKVLLLGYASGYAARAISQRTKAVTLVYEPSINILHQGLPHLPPDDRIQIFTSVEALTRYLESHQAQATVLKTIGWPASARIQGQHFERATTIVKNCIRKIQLTQSTQAARSRIWLKNYLQNLPQLTRHPDANAYRDAFAGYPAIICAAGPSLTKNAPLLKQLQGQCLIIAVNTAAQALASMGLEAHIIVSVESLDITSQFEKIPWIDRCTAFLEVTGTPAAFELPFETIVPISVYSEHISDFSDRMSPGISMPSGLCVAHAAVALAARLGCTGLVLIGQDLSFTDGQAYAKGSVFEDMQVSNKDGHVYFHNIENRQKILDASDPEARSAASSAEREAATTMPAWGDTKRKVETTWMYAMFAKWFSDASEKLSAQGIWHINATEGGIDIENWEALSLAKAIQRHQLDKAPKSPQAQIRNRLKALGQQSSVPASTVARELNRERSIMADTLKPLEQLRSLGVERSQEESELWAQVRRQVQDCHLLQSRLTLPLATLVKRQEVNTQTLIQVLETEIRHLTSSIESVLTQLESDAPQKRAAS